MQTKKIGFWALVFMNVSALYGIRWIAKSTAANFGLGLGAIPMWVLFSFIFFVPAALICAELAATYPTDGGLYEWVKEAYGKKTGFMVSWLNWSAKIFWYSSFLTFMMVNITYAIGKPALADNKLLVTAASIIIFWILSFLSCKGMIFGKVFTNTGALGSTIPTVILIVMAFITVAVLKKQPSASVYSVANMIPKLNTDSMVAISAIMFGMAGAETTANFISEIDEPHKNFPRAIVAAAAIVGLLYVLGSIAITSILPIDKITASKGVLDALNAASLSLGLGTWLTQILAFGITVSILGAIILYIASPIKMLFGSIEKGIFPQTITAVNAHNIPQNAVLLQAALVTVLMVATSVMPSVDAIYNVLVTMTALTSLFPYILLFGAYIKLRKTRPNEHRPYQIAKNTGTAVIIAYMVLTVTVFGIVMSAAPVMPTLMENIIYECEMIGGAVVVILAGLLLWKRYEKNRG